MSVYVYIYVYCLVGERLIVSRNQSALGTTAKQKRETNTTRMSACVDTYAVGTYAHMLFFSIFFKDVTCTYANAFMREFSANIYTHMNIYTYIIASMRIYVRVLC